MYKLLQSTEERKKEREAQTKWAAPSLECVGDFMSDSIKRFVSAL
jgi:hypothetical protein